MVSSARIPGFGVDVFLFRFESRPSGILKFRRRSTRFDEWLIVDIS